MFTGLIEKVGTILRLDRSGSAAMLKVSDGFPRDEVKIGDSIAVNGVCLTVTSMDGKSLDFDMSTETLDRTSFRKMRPGFPVNLERALRLSDRLGGHIVSGHVDCVAIVSERRELSGNILFSFRMPKEYTRFLVEKGSVTIDGISLTVNAADDDGFTVNIIPHTASNTTLRELKPGGEVNIETDILGKYVERLLARKEHDSAGGVSLELLAKSGFL